MAYGTVNTDLITNSNGLSGNAIGPGFKNRIINGAMVIDQRNAGASTTPTSSGYTLDRWRAALNQASKFSVQQSSTAAIGFINSLLVTSLSAYSVGASDFFMIGQRIEGLNVSDLAWGTANAKTVTLSFWVRSSLTGTFGGALSNSAEDRSYPFTYSISAANTWEQKSVTIVGDTSGTWLTTSGIGLEVWLGLGVGTTYSGTAGAWAGAQYFSATGATSVVGTNGATFYITGVQLEVGSTATSFDYRPYGTELALCQRYYYKVAPGSGKYLTESAFGVATTSAYGSNKFPVTMRVAPTALEQSGTASNYLVIRCGSATNVTCSGVPTFAVATEDRAFSSFPVASGLTNSGAGTIEAAVAAAYLAWSAEL